MRIGIFFGGSSREREISFAGGRTVYDNLDKELFEAVPIFMDSHHNLILLDWHYIYKGTIRDFFPPVSSLPESPNGFQIYQESIKNPDFDQMISEVGRKIDISELKDNIDFAFLCLHGSMGEDGTIQGMFEWLGIPYSGSGVRASAIGIDKAFQKRLFQQAGLPNADFFTVRREEWLPGQCPDSFIRKIEDQLGFPCVIRPACQGSSIGVSIINENDPSAIAKAVDAGFFIRVLEAEEWLDMDRKEQLRYVFDLVDIKEGMGMPVDLNGEIIYHPEELLVALDKRTEKDSEPIILKALKQESEVVIEAFIKGKEFSCVVVEGRDGEPIALPPTEIVKSDEVYDYRSKYLAGLSRKVTPIRLPLKDIEKIRTACAELYQFLDFDVYARIDGFIQEDGKVILNDPNTTSGMLPSSFFFHQAAEVGMNPSQFLTYIIHASLKSRKRSGSFGPEVDQLLMELDTGLKSEKAGAGDKVNVAVIMGGYSSERHISVESGRNIYEKLYSSTKYAPVPFFLIKAEDKIRLFRLPVNLLLKDNADDIRDQLESHRTHEIIENIREDASWIIETFTGVGYSFVPQEYSFKRLSNEMDAVFIALHGRPGEDGELQKVLEEYNLPYNGSLPGSSEITIDKHVTKEKLRNIGFKEALDLLIPKDAWQLDKNDVKIWIEKEVGYPLIAKPVDDGCSSAVKRISSWEELEIFAEAMFREQEELGEEQMVQLSLKPREEFPRKEVILLEELIGPKDASKFLEVTVGLLTHHTESGALDYEVFEPSETLAGDSILSLEEKFLAGQGQNITPARFSADKENNDRISAIVRKDIEKAARALEVQGYCRIDAFVRIFADGRVETIVIEVNSLPGMTPATCIFHQAAINGYKPFDFIDEILTFSLNRNRIEVY